MDYEDWTARDTLGGRYVLQAQVGTGRTTTVFAADDLRLERRVAVKLFHDVPDYDGLARFSAETQVLAGLSHPGLVTVYDVNLDDDRPYMVMRLIDGGTLSDEVSVEPLDPPEVARLGAQLADVLAYVHERGVVHGDIDARNVLVDAQGSGNLTGFGVNLGLGRPSGDIYALGMMLAGCLPYGLGPEWQAVLGAMTNESPDERPDAVRCGEVLRNIESGSTSEFLLPLFDTNRASADEPDYEPYDAENEPDGEEEADRPVRRVVLSGTAKHKQRMRPVAYTGLAGMGLAVAALAVVLATVGNGSSEQPSGEQRQPSVEKPTEGTHIQPPGQSYPGGPPEDQQRGEARDSGPKPPRRAGRTSTAPPSSTTAPPTSPSDNPPGDEGPGNGNGNNGNGNDDNNGQRHRSLLDILLGIG
jgi:serine/threonine protein kinase